MRTTNDIEDLLPELESCCADTLEDQDLDFKEWIERSLDDSVRLVVESAICMANGGGGTVIFGVRDRVVGRAHAILGVPSVVDLNLLRKAVYDRTDPKLTPVFESLAVPEGTGRLLVMQVHPGLPPYTNTAGQGWIRVGKDCQPLTGTLRRRVMVETGETDHTAETLPGAWLELASPSAMERLRETARQERAPSDLLTLDDGDLLQALGVIRDGRMTRAGVLLAGNANAVQRHLHGYCWTHLRMVSDTNYRDRSDGTDALPVALNRLLEQIMADNPITTIQHGMFHFEYRTYPEIALREALMNALCHADYRIASPILVKQYPQRLEISNPGGFIAGISPANVLHHEPAARNPLLVNALVRLRLVNRSNLGMSRMFEAMLVEGKEPPTIEEVGESVRVTFPASPLSPEFRAFVAEKSRAGRLFSVDELLVFRYLLGHSEVDTATAAILCQRGQTQMRDLLAKLETEGLLERGGSRKGTYWALPPIVHRKLAAVGHAERDQRLDWEAAKARVHSILKRRSDRGEPGLSNREIRQVTHLDRHQAKRLLLELQTEGVVVLEGRGRAARWVFVNQGIGADN